jgi:hypothetical protein
MKIEHLVDGASVDAILKWPGEEPEEQIPVKVAISSLQEEGLIVTIKNGDLTLANFLCNAPRKFLEDMSRFFAKDNDEATFPVVCIYIQDRPSSGHFTGRTRDRFGPALIDIDIFEEFPDGKPFNFFTLRFDERQLKHLVHMLDQAFMSLGKDSDDLRRAAYESR